MPARPDPDASLSRRGFVLTAAAATASLGAAQAPAPAPTPPVLSPVAEAQLQALLAKHGKQFSDAQKADIRRLLSEAAKPSEELRKFSLTNADEPALVLHLFTGARR
jgi:hypothetical protein